MTAKLGSSQGHSNKNAATIVTAHNRYRSVCIARLLRSIEYTPDVQLIHKIILPMIVHTGSDVGSSRYPLNGETASFLILDT